MSVHRGEALKIHRGELEPALLAEVKRPLPNLALVREITRRTLAMRDEIALLRQARQCA